jgi:hypothetical protein
MRWKVKGPIRLKILSKAKWCAALMFIALSKYDMEVEVRERDIISPDSYNTSLNCRRTG